MGYKAIYTYAWDLAEAGVSAAADRFLALGLDTVTIAGSYHAGKFLRPHGATGNVAFPEDGTVYFNRDPRRYGVIKPVANSMLASGHDMVRALAAQGRLATNVWFALRSGGVREAAFYNWGHLRNANLDWIAEGLAAMEEAAGRPRAALQSTGRRGHSKRRPEFNQE